MIRLRVVSKPVFGAVVSLLTTLFLTACTPTVKVAAPEKPIEINLNVKIEHEIRVKVDQQLDDILADDELF